jgi:integrase
MSVKVRPYKRGGWEVDIRVRMPTGAWVRERLKSYVTTKNAALRWGQERERLHVLGQIVKPATPAEKQVSEGKTGTPQKPRVVPTFKEFAPRFIEGYARANRQKPSTIDAKETHQRVHILPMFGKMRLDELRNEDVQRFKATFAAKSPKTANNVLSTLSMMLKIAIEWGVIDTMPARIKLLKISPSKYAFYDYEVYDKLVAAAAKLDWRIQALVLLAGDAGLRRGEIIALDRTDFDVQRRLLTVNRAEWKGQVSLPKGGRIRHVPMTQRLADLLQANQHLRGDRVLLRDDGGPLTAKVVLKWMKRAQKRAVMVADGRIHILRHTFCSHLAMRGAPTLAIQELAGHTNLTTTMRYMHLSPSEKTRAISLLDQRHAEVAGALPEGPEADRKEG